MLQAKPRYLGLGVPRLALQGTSVSRKIVFSPYFLYQHPGLTYFMKIYVQIFLVEVEGIESGVTRGDCKA